MISFGRGGWEGGWEAGGMEGDINLVVNSLRPPGPQVGCGEVYRPQTTPLPAPSVPHDETVPHDVPLYIT